jgi:hypothetical protein
MDPNTKTTLKNAAIGAVVTVGLAPTGFSALLGGGIAGYLQRESPKRGARVGAISGGLASLPVVLVLLLGASLFLLPTTQFGVPGGLELVIILFVMFPLLFAWTIGLSAVGGYLGAYLRSDRRPASDEGATADSRP